MTDEEESNLAHKIMGLHRFCKGEDMGRLIAFLVSDANSYMVGELLNMSPGMIGGFFP